MPAFRPALRDSVLVLKVVLEDDDPVELATGGSLGDITGVLRIKERKSNGIASGDVIGAVVYVAEPGRNGDPAGGKFQVTVGMAADKFATLLTIANAGRMPTRFSPRRSRSSTTAIWRASATPPRGSRSSRRSRCRWTCPTSICARSPPSA